MEIQDHYATFNYTHDMVKEAILAYHEKKIHFCHNNYDTEIHILAGSELMPMFFVTINPKPKATQQGAWARLLYLLGYSS